ncbi:LysM peptidoglycan-binding domain-containing protein [Balneolaceae bacterium YR4-1]|uniref:LysM peptidoglycan-binding domain-containing protein n=1 Tax=Halalkalibaculum roseum TaxID=2709311 RepID=A0A6M1SX97_9BACT|nr:LysM peptidoglycan-binding domain-containing protein [Halalkalibaculum roseum]NGP77612.1 LysM peptidoglycan-binding domain-containing protein [Halalkalibaculum roseum]
MTIRLSIKVFITTFLCFLFVNVATAQQKTHTVESGETLFSIAQQFEVTVQKLKEWNNLQNNQLTIGQTLIVQSADQESAKTHTVEPQETLFSISKQYGVSIAEIKSWNNLDNNNLNVGQELIIYPSSIDNTDNGTGAGNSIVVSNETQQNTYYTVKSGDTLYKIARAHNMTLDELKTLNDLSSNTISIGQQLTVKARSTPPSVAESATESSPQGKFVNYRIGERQNLETILNRFQMGEEEFRALNPDVTTSTFQIGQQVTVLAPATKSYKNPYKTGAGLKDLGETPVSTYSDTEKGQTTTSGELFVPDELTAAHSNIALGTIIFIENPENNKGIYVRINDRISSNGLKLSDGAWQALSFASNSPRVKIYQDQ